jgi:bacterioferritin (cytochrome b1)
MTDEKLPGHHQLGALTIVMVCHGEAINDTVTSRYDRGVALAVARGDNGTHELLEHRLVDEEAHADWLESQQTLIAQVGVENYLATQIHCD